VQKLLGHSDPKITERRCGHLLPEFMSAELNRLRFGLGTLVPVPPPPAAVRWTRPAFVRREFHWSCKLNQPAEVDLRARARISE